MFAAGSSVAGVGYVALMAGVFIPGVVYKPADAKRFADAYNHTLASELGLSDEDVAEKRPEPTSACDGSERQAVELSFAPEASRIDAHRRR